MLLSSLIIHDEIAGASAVLSTSSSSSSSSSSSCLQLFFTKSPCFSNEKLEDAGKMVKRLNEIGGQLTVVSRRGGGGGGHAIGGHGGGHGGSAGHSHGSSNEHGQGRSPFTNVVPLYAAGGAAAANNRHHHGGTSGGALNCRGFGHLAYIVLAVLILVCIIY